MIAAEKFLWVVKDKFGGMPHPEYFGNLMQNLQKLEEIGIGIIITLTEDSLNRKLVEDYGFEYHHIPITDFTSPILEQLLEAKQIYENAKKPIAVHCLAGMGRTGTILSAFLVLEGFTTDEAVKKVRQIKPGSVETFNQVESVRNFELFLKASP